MTFSHIGKANFRCGVKHVSSYTSRMKNVSSPNLSASPTTISSTIKNRSCGGVKINSSNSFKNSNQQSFKKFSTASESQTKANMKGFNAAPKPQSKYMKTSANRNRYLLEDIRLGARIMSTQIVGELLNHGETFNNCVLAVYNWDDDGT